MVAQWKAPLLRQAPKKHDRAAVLKSIKKYKERDTVSRKYICAVYQQVVTQ